MMTAISSVTTSSLLPQNIFPIEEGKQLNLYSIGDALKSVDTKVDIFISRSHFPDLRESLDDIRSLYTDCKVCKINLIGSGQPDLNWVQLSLKKPFLPFFRKNVSLEIQQIKLGLRARGLQCSQEFLDSDCKGQPRSVVLKLGEKEFNSETNSHQPTYSGISKVITHVVFPERNNVLVCSPHDKLTILQEMKKLDGHPLER
ncbi:MAG: hypothetical protein JSS09_01120 [Verrucomicrobia bacterium]|nr:hypothetical protein [Verrucomicrobiota bacterium]